MCEISIERVELLFPERAVLGEPGCGVLQGLNAQTAAADAARLSLRHQARPFEHAQMLHHGGKRHSVGPRQLRDGSLSAQKMGQDSPPRGIGKSPERCVQPAGILNHVDKYIRGPSLVKTNRWKIPIIPEVSIFQGNRMG